MENTKIINFTDLRVWQTAHQFVLEIYHQTKLFPREELFGLVSQLRRAAVSITSNIAEGFCRTTARDKIRFYTLALGSLTEIQNQIIIAKDINYISSENFKELSNILVDIRKMIYGLINSAENK